MVSTGRDNNGNLTININMAYLVIATVLSLGAVVSGGAKYVEWRIEEKAFCKESGIRIEEKLDQIRKDIKLIKERMDNDEIKTIGP